MIHCFSDRWKCSFLSSWKNSKLLFNWAMLLPGWNRLRRANKHLSRNSLAILSDTSGESVFIIDHRGQWKLPYRYFKARTIYSETVPQMLAIWESKDKIDHLIMSLIDRKCNWEVCCSFRCVTSWSLYGEPVEWCFIDMMIASHR